MVNGNFKSGEPIFQRTFCSDWNTLPKVFGDHYCIRANTEDRVRVKSQMRLHASIWVRLMAPFFRRTQTLVPRSGEAVETQVVFYAEQGCFVFDRSFTFKDGETYQFVSFLEPGEADTMVEWTKSGIGWHCRYRVQDQQIRLEHIGYRLRLFGKDLPLPLTLLMGTPSAWERVVDETRFDMSMEIRHPVLGRIYGYEGRFEITEVLQA